MITTMCSIFGIVSVPSGNVGFGRDPGLRTTAGFTVVGVLGRVDPGDELVVALDDFDDELHAARSATNNPAPTMPMPCRRRRREREVSLSTTPFTPRAGRMSGEIQDQVASTDVVDRDAVRAPTVRLPPQLLHVVSQLTGQAMHFAQTQVFRK